MIFDTDVMIWLLRGNLKAAKLINNSPKRGITVFTELELFHGLKNKSELKLIKSLLLDFDFTVWPLTENIGHRALIYMEEFGLSQGLCTVDALIAACVVEHNETLCTANFKHFKFIPGLEMNVFKVT